MKLQFLIAVAGLASVASAQATRDDIVVRGTPRYAGVLDLATGVLTPPQPGQQQAVAPDVIYDNTCINPALFTFSPLSTTQTRVDDGRVPSKTSTPIVGAVNKYRITQISIGYGTNVSDTTIGGPGASLTYRVWGDYDDCTLISANAAPLITLNLTGLPGALTAGTNTGILLDIALPPALQFDLLGDANGSFDGAAALDKFGFGMSVPTPAVAGSLTGPIRAGHATTCVVGDGTYYQNPGVAVDGTGLDNAGTYTQDDNGVLSCFVHNPAAGSPIYVGYWFEMMGDFNDCDGNGISDASDIAAGAPDTNANGIPDSCEAPVPTNYCTPGTTTNNCVATMSATGSPSAAATSGFTLTCNNAEGAKQGIIFYGNMGQAAAPWTNGLGQGNSFLCVKAPTQRTGAQTMSGTINQCNGAMSVDFLAFCAANVGAVGNPLSAGQTFDAQGWFRDPPSPKTTNLSDGIEWTMVP
jgi:hypothetical protein